MGKAQSELSCIKSHNYCGWSGNLKLVSGGFFCSPLWKATCLLYCLHGPCQGYIFIKYLPGKPVQWKNTFYLNLKDLRFYPALCWQAACLWSYMLMFSFFISVETSTIFYPTTLNGQFSSIQRKSKFYFSFFLSCLSMLLLVFCLSPTVTKVLRRNFLTIRVLSGTLGHCFFNRTQNSSDQYHWKSYNKSKHTLFIISLFSMTLLYKTSRYIRLN